MTTPVAPYRGPALFGMLAAGVLTGIAGTTALLYAPDAWVDRAVRVINHLHSRGS